MSGAPWVWRCGEGPLLATAIHAGSELRDEAARLTGLRPEERRREEDPFTGAWTDVAETSVVFRRSRFEVDVNRPRPRAVYLQPEDCWGLPLWRAAPPSDFIARSCALYDAFYAELERECRRLIERHGHVVVLDLHSYNHRRLGPDAPAADPRGNPEVNVGTASLDRRRWGRLVDRFVADVCTAGFDARENIRFTGAQLAAWVHQRFPAKGCCLAVDVKKIYMDEHTGAVDQRMLDRLHGAFAGAVPGLIAEAARVR